MLSDFSFWQMQRRRGSSLNKLNLEKNLLSILQNQPRRTDRPQVQEGDDGRRQRRPPGQIQLARPQRRPRRSPRPSVGQRPRYRRPSVVLVLRRWRWRLLDRQRRQRPHRLSGPATSRPRRRVGRRGRRRIEQRRKSRLGTRFADESTVQR